jgi:predicted metal-dependent hydrolase
MGELVLRPLDVRFDWTGLPLQWVPGEPAASHILNTLHLLLPEGERWFVETFKQALPLIRDDMLREDVLGFIGQEAIHAEAHQGVLDYFATHDMDPTPYTRQMEWLFRKVLGDRDRGDEARKRDFLIEKVAFVAAIEHYTAFLGDWVLDTPGLDRAQADPVMLDLLRWHGSEEVVHRSVAYDLMVHLDPSYGRRVRGLLIGGPILFWLWARGARFLMATDPSSSKQKVTIRAWQQAAGKCLLPAPRALLRSAFRYLRPGYHPSLEGSTSRALEYLAASPAAKAAAA